MELLVSVTVTTPISQVSFTLILVPSLFSMSANGSNDIPRILGGKCWLKYSGFCALVADAIIIENVSLLFPVSKNFE